MKTIDGIVKKKCQYILGVGKIISSGSEIKTNVRKKLLKIIEINTKIAMYNNIMDGYNKNTEVGTYRIRTKYLYYISRIFIYTRQGRILDVRSPLI